MKNTIIIIMCSLMILGLLALGVVLKDANNNLWAIVLTALIVFPAYFLYTAVLDMRYSRQYASQSPRKHKKKPMFSRGKSNDKGKILYFPDDKKTKGK